MVKASQTEPDHLKSLVEEVAESKAVLCKEARDKYGRTVVKAAVEKRYCIAIPTPLGEALSLAHKGRKTTGLKGSYKPSSGAVANALAVRFVISSLVANGYEVVKIERRSAVEVRGEQGNFIAIARYTGYDHATIRRVFDELILGQCAPELRVYVGEDKIESLSKMVWPKSAARRTHMTPERLKILAVPIYLKG